MPDELPISDAEWEVMNVVWERAPVTAADVVAALADAKNWHPRTVKTLLHRLVKKQVLDYQPDGPRYLYSPRLNRDACVRRASQSFLSRVFAGEAVPLLEHFVKRGNLTRAELEQLKRLLDEETRRND